MVLQNGEKVFIITRRIFPQDLRRHFVGEVIECTNSAARVRGYSFVFDDGTGEFVRRDDLRTRIFSLTSDGFIINVIPIDTVFMSVHYSVNEKNQRILTDGKTFTMNVSEFSIRMYSSLDHWLSSVLDSSTDPGMALVQGI